MMTNLGRCGIFVQFQIKIVHPLQEMILERKTIWMTEAVGPGSLETGCKIKHTKKALHSKLSLKSTLVFSVMYRRRGHQSDVQNSEGTGVVIILDVRALHSQT